MATVISSALGEVESFEVSGITLAASAARTDRVVK